MNEYEELSGNTSYTETLDKVNYDIANKTRLSGLITSYYLLLLSKEKGIEALKKWNVFVTDNTLRDLKNVEVMIKALKTNIRIDEMRGKKEENKPFNFDLMLVNIENNLNRNIPEDLTVSKWCSLVKSIERKHMEIEKIKSHGRNY